MCFFGFQPEFLRYHHHILGRPKPMHEASFKPRRACVRPLENFLRDPKPQKNSKIRIFRSVLGVEFFAQNENFGCGDFGR